MRTLTLALAALGCALALPSAASAAYSLGNHPDGILEGTSTACAGGCTIVQDWEANEQQRVPGWLGEHQVVVQWRVRGDGEQARLQRVTVGAGGTASAPATNCVQINPTPTPSPTPEVRSRSAASCSSSAARRSSPRPSSSSPPTPRARSR